MAWDDWSKAEPMRLAYYVTPDAMLWFDGRIHHDNLALLPNGLYQTAQALYEALLQKIPPINYAPEKYNYTLAQQKIRTPAEILDTPGEGTCLDLALLFCGLCLGHNLLPLLIVLNGHVLAGISLKNRLPEWNKNRPGRELFDGAKGPEKGLLSAHQTERYAHFCELTSEQQKVFLPIECTGFAQSQRLSQSIDAFPETRNRQANGTLTFEQAVLAGREQLTLQNGRRFLFALDIAMAQAHLGKPYALIPQGWAGGTDRKQTLRSFSTNEIFSLADLLLTCPSIKDRETRQTILNMLDDQIATNIPRHNSAKTDVINIILTCRNYANGLEQLITLTSLFEGPDSLALQNLQTFLANNQS